MKIDPALLKLYNRVKNKKPIFLSLSETMAAAIQKNFDSEGHRLGKKWEPLKPSTLAQKRRKSRASAILQSRGQLIKSIQSNHSDSEASAGTNLRYAAAHNYGAKIYRKSGSSVLNFRKYKRGKHKGKTLFTKERNAQFSQKVLRKAGSITIPKREFLALNKEDMKTMGSDLARLILGKQ